MKRRVNPVGKKYGKLLVLEEMSSPIESTQKYRSTLLRLKCQCDCGSIVTVFKGNVLYGKTTQCRECQNSHIVIGEKRGTLTVLSRAFENGPRKYLCKCDCGLEGVYRSWFLENGKKICCEKCRFPKKYEPQIPKKTKKEAIEKTNFDKHLRSRDSLIGKKSGRLKIIAFSHWEQKENRRRSYYRAKCKCGNEVILRDCFAIKSCGCLHKESIRKGEDQKHARLTNKQVLAIREFKSCNIGYTGRQLADMFGVNEAIISNVLSEKTYKGIK